MHHITIGDGGITLEISLLYGVQWVVVGGGAANTKITR